MKIYEYLKDRFPFLAANAILFAAICCVLYLLDIATALYILLFCVWFLPLLAYLITEAVKQKRFFDTLDKTMEQLDQKYLLAEMISEPGSADGKALYRILRDNLKAMNEHINEYSEMQGNYKNYIEMWVHEIKTPIASARLITENNKSPAMDNISFEIRKIEDYVEQVLYYARSSNANKDYIIKDMDLRETVNAIIRRNARSFISKRISVDVEQVEGTVHSDSKWVEFILNQIILNSIKYCGNDNGKVNILSVRNPENIILSVADNGIGISEKDLRQVFEKGFTGENGRKYGSSTGIGLYLCRELCKKLGLGIRISSKTGMGTTVDIIFPVGTDGMLRKQDMNNIAKMQD